MFLEDVIMQPSQGMSRKHALKCRGICKFFVTNNNNDTACCLSGLPRASTIQNKICERLIFIAWQSLYDSNE
jgi:hypothetical protein